MKKDQNCGELLQLLSHAYYKVLRVDLTEDTHEEIYRRGDDLLAQTEKTPKLSEWLHGLSEVGCVYGDDREKYLRFTDIRHFRQEFHDGKSYICCHFRRRVQGEYRWTSMELVPACDYTDEHQLALLYFKDIHDQYVEDIEEKDFLTGGINRRGFFRRVREILHGEEATQRFVLLFFNIKGFKAINEMFGTVAGDMALHNVYRHLKEARLRPLALARTGGDHFLCLANQKDLHMDELSELCCEAMTWNDKKVTLHIECGVFYIEDPSMDVNLMCDCARIATEYIVDEYLKPYAVFGRDMMENYLTGTEVRRNLSGALERGEFKVYYQPIFDARTEELVSAEALVRWMHPERGLISPGVFIPILEQNGYISQVDYYILKTVKNFQETRREQKLRVVPVSVNLSWMDFYDTHMMDSIKSGMEKEEGKHGMTRLEVTETSYAALTKREGNVIEDLRKLGATVLLDDFGSGYSSFSTICEYDFDIIKLDMEFVRRLGKDEKISSIIHSIIDMSHHMNAKVIAEGVETKEQLEFLARHGCDYIQGYYFSKPLPQREFEALLA